MSTDFERELRAGMKQAPIRPRPGTVREAFRCSRRRRRAIRATVAAGTAIAATIATVFLATGAGRERVETTAYVVSQMNSALAAANSDILYVYQGGVDPAQGDGKPGDSGDFGIHYWGYGNRSRELTILNGVKHDTWDTLTPVKQGILDTETSADYEQRQVIVAPTIIPGTAARPSPTCSGGLGGLQAGPGYGWVENASWLAAYMHTQLDCGGFTASWNQRVNGTQAIKLVAHQGAVTWWAWIDQATFLPIAEGYSSPVKVNGSNSAWFAWLPPTTANLASLTGVVPAGFKTIRHPVTTRYSFAPHASPRSRLIPPVITGNGPAATVARRMAGAINTTSREIYYTHQVMIGSPSVTQTHNSWIYPGKVRFQTFYDGKPGYDNTTITSPAGHGQVRTIQTSVDYGNRQVLQSDDVGPADPVWYPRLPTPSAVCGLAAGGQGPTFWVQGFSTEYGAGNVEAVTLWDLLACPHVTLAVTWHQRLNGTEAVKIVWPVPRQHSTDTFWLDESTYALIGVSVVTDPGYHQTMEKAVIDSMSTEMLWLPPSPANLALFHLYVPPGFAGAKYVTAS
jgi:hypothetical protein